MTQVMAEAVREHDAKFWGTPTKVRSFQYGPHELAVQKWDAEANPWEVNMYATVGASSFPQVGYPTSHRVEFFIGLLPAEDAGEDAAEDAVEKVLANVAFFPLREQTQIGPGHTITWADEPLWPGTTMQSILVDRTNDELVPMLVVEGDEPVHIEFLDITLLYSSELAFKQQHSLKALFEHWYKHDVNYTDPRRPPEPA